MQKIRHMLKEEQIQHFHDFGYLVIERDKDYQEFNAARKACGQIVDKCLKTDYQYYRSDRRLSDAFVEKIEHVFGPELFDEILFRAIVESEILDYTCQLLATDNIYLAFNRMHVTHKYSAWSNWHRDGFPDGKDYFIKATMPFYNETGFFVVPGSHKMGNTYLDSGKADTRIRHHVKDELRIPVRAGDLLFFNNAILHRGTCAGRERYKRAHLHLCFGNMKGACDRGQVEQNYLNRKEIVDLCDENWKEVLSQKVPQTYKPTLFGESAIKNRLLKQTLAKAYYHLSAIMPSNSQFVESPSQNFVPYVRVPKEYSHFYKDA